MYQFYFLSVIANLLAGFALCSEYFEEKMGAFEAVRVFLENTAFRNVVALVAVITGVLKLLSVTSGDMVFFGDLIPSVTGIFLGLLLFLDYYRNRSEVVSPTIEKMEQLFLARKAVFGVIGIIVAVLHFVFPGVLLL
ncbi:MAG: hypothetical protein ACLFR1_13110 [Spirochaetia bacterium]